VKTRLLTTLAATALLAAAPANAYYYFVHYLASGNAPEKFDLAALPSKTVTFLVSENVPAVYGGTDSLNSVLGQIEQAAAIWNGVATSDLRVAFGGFENGNTPQNAPGGDILFDDLPPGVEGFGGPTSKAAPVTAADGSQFFPVLRSAIHLNRNLVLAPGPSFSQSFLLTTVHEMGHALGLQHTFTSAAMSQTTTSATSLVHPIDNDDVAGISSLYPNAAFQQFGSIAGQVTAGGNGVHMASVVAIQPGFGAISAVTNPDGSFAMNGVPPGTYSIYVHTMPPDADIYGPWNPDASVVPPSSPVNTVFYTQTGSGTNDINQATPVVVKSAAVTSGIGFTATGRASVPFYDGQVFGFFGSKAVMPAPVNLLSTGVVTIVASVVGLGSNGQAPGLGVQITGGGAAVRSNGVRPYQSNGYTYVALDLNLNASAPPGPQHMIFTTPDYTYVLPSAMYLTQSAPPAVTAVSSNNDGTATVSGSNWNPGTQLYFDSLPATVYSLDTTKGAAIVIPPPGANGQQATLTAFNPDGQNSQFVQTAAVTFPYGNLPSPSITSISPSLLPAGAEAMVDIAGTGFAFTTGPNSVGFGTSDILVRRIFVLSANHIQVDVSVPPNAALTSTDVTVMSGFAVATMPSGFQIAAQFAGLPAPVPVLTNSFAGLNGAYPGATVNLYGSNLAIGTSAPPTVTIGGVPVAVSFWSPGQLTLQLPSALPAGIAALAINNGTLNSYPVLLNIDATPAGIIAVQFPDGAYVDSLQGAHPGNTLIVTLFNLTPAGFTTALNRVQVGLGGVLHTPSLINQVGSYTQITFQIGAGDPVGTSQQLVVYLDGRSSLPAYIQVQP
jgi:hypothetical protein